MSNLSQREAVKAYRKVCLRYGTTPHPVVRQGMGGWPSGPVLCRDYEGWYSTTRWAVIWEGGPYDWTMEHFEEDLGVFVEPINGFALGLYQP